ncbi:MAG: hypothetical protein ACLQFR_01025 [Streptosporangiaceae bacterium]
MTGKSRIVPDCVTAYAARLHAAIGTEHHAASPLGAWLLLALAGPAARGGDRATLARVLDCDVATAAAAAAELLADPHPLVAAAAAVWKASWAPLPAEFATWQRGLPPQVASGELPDQAGLDKWAREHTFGLIGSFPIKWTPNLYLVLATALATKVSWQMPFELAPAASLGPRSPWADLVSQVLRTPAQVPGSDPARDDQARSGHVQFIAVTPEAGDVAVHIAAAVGGLLVASVAASPEVPASTVLALAHRIGTAYATGGQVPQRSLAELPLGDGPCWQLREEMAGTDRCTAILPAWSARSVHDLDHPGLGFGAAAHALTESDDPWEAKQAVQATYSRTGFEAAAVTGLGIRLMAMAPPRQHRVAELRFGYPYAVVALTTAAGEGDAPAARASPWLGLPVFSAWVAQPSEA